MLRSIRWKRHRWFITASIGALAILIAVVGDTRVTALTSSAQLAMEDTASIDIAGQLDIFDDSTVHEISVSFDQADYDRMVATYQAEGSKEYIEASITIDGVSIDSVGLRLKGNSTLRGMSGTGNELAPNQNAPGGIGRIGGGMTGDLTFDDPAGVPWLISFDEFIDGQTYQGFEEIAVRPMTTSETMLNEALALSLVGSAGEPTQRASYTSFAVNGGAATLRLLVEIPEDAYVEANFESDGVLYKALSTGSFAYRGEDPLAYADSFKQITRKKQQDLAPLIELLRWVSEATDEEFAEQLDEYVDVDSLARYSALHEQLNNFDDMSGPGQNYYLWYDLASERFTVLTWDLNLAFGQGFIGGAQGQLGPGGQIPGDPQNGQQRLQPPAGQTPPDAGETPQPPAGQTFPDAGENPRNPGGQVPGGGQMGGGNKLKERFLASAAFEEVYATQYAAVHDALFGSGQAVAELERLSAVISGSGLIDAATLEQESAALRSALETADAAEPNAP